VTLLTPVSATGCGLGRLTGVSVPLPFGSTGAPAYGRIIALVPAHNEEESLPATLRSLQHQTLRPDEVIVVADNCTDGTERIARELGAQTITTAANADKKAGALNQALALILPTTSPADLVLVMDADTALAPHFFEVAAEEPRDGGVAAVGGIFSGEPGHGLVGQLQRSEYTRYAHELGRTGRVMVLTGKGRPPPRIAVFRIVPRPRRRPEDRPEGT